MAALLFAAVIAACVAAGVCTPPSVRPRLDLEPPQYANVWAVQVEGSIEEADALAKKYNFINKGQVGILKNVYKFVLPVEVYQRQSKSITTAYKQVTDALMQEIHVTFAEQQVMQKVEKKGYLPPTDPQWDYQWCLSNRETGVLGENANPALDVNVEPAWIQGLTGCHVIVGVVDDGVEFTHPDLSSNYILDRDYNYLTDKDDAFPLYVNGTRESHGTSCAGIIAMEKSNRQCGVGVAYRSNITGILLISDSQGSTDVDNANALSHEIGIIDIYSNSWGPLDKGFFVGGPGRYAKMTLEQGAREGRDGKGAIYVWAAGNGGEYNDSCAADGYINSIYTIAIGAATNKGQPAPYDERCSGKLAVTFVYNDFSLTDVLTTAVHDNCVNDFGGTSAATPVASGAIALTLEANPDLTWRDVQYLIAYTSNPDILTGDEWVTNGAGLRVNHHFGFGAVDAEAMVTRARHWTNVPEQQMSTIPIRDTTLVQPLSTEEITIPFSGDIGYLEHVVVQVSLSFQGVDAENYREDNAVYYDLYYYFDDFTEQLMPNRGDIKLELLSPQRTTSVLLPFRSRDTWPGDYSDWPFMSVHFWGEDPSGDWTLTVINDGLMGIVEVRDLQFIFYGTVDTPPVIARIPSQCDDACFRGCAAPGPDFCDACRQYRNAKTLECVENCPNGYIERSGYCYNASEPEPECVPIELPTSSALKAGGAHLLFAVISVMLCVISWLL